MTVKDRNKEEELLENEDVRSKYLNKVGELEKIKKLALLPNTELMTTRAVAEYFEVGYEAIATLYKRHNEELVRNGAKHMKYKEFSNQFKLNGLEINPKEYGISPRGSNIYTKRAVLNVGMLLRDSEIAQRLRSNILDTYEAAPDEVKANPIDHEQSLLLNVIYAKDDAETALALNRFRTFKDQHINKLEHLITEQEPKVYFHDQVTSSVNVVDMITTAKSIGVGRDKLFKFLRATKVLFKQNGDNHPYQKYQNEGYFKIETSVREDKYGRTLTTHSTRVTGSGKVFIHSLVERYGGAEKINSLPMREIKDYVKEYNKQLI